MNSLNVNQTGGFPMTTRILDEIQTAYSLFNNFGAIVGDKTIISGCVTTGNLVSNGVVYVNNETFDFIGGTLQTKVKIVEATETLVFEDGAAKTVIKKRCVTFGTGVGEMLWADFVRPPDTKAIEGILTTIGQQLSAIATKLGTIDENAKVQVNTDWNATTGKAQLLNKPNVIAFLHKGTKTNIDPIGTDSLVTVTIPDVGTNNYMVLGSMVSLGGNFDPDNDVIWMIRDKQSNYFKIALRDTSNGSATQNLTFEYILVPL